MSSAGKWVLGLLLLVVGAVFVARTVASDPVSQAEVKNLPVAQAAADKAKKPAGPVVAADLACKKACVEVNEVANDSVTTAKLAPGSVTLSKLAFEVPNLNELENEINARKATEATLKASQASLSATQAAAAEAAATAIEANARNAAAINAAAANGITAEAAARQAADEDISSKFAAGDADLQNKLNKEGADRAAGDDALQSKLNKEIDDRTGAISNLRGELANPNQVDAPIIKINNNEIVDSAVTSAKLKDGTITADDLGTGSVVGGENGDVLDDTISFHDLADDAVVGRAIAGDPFTNVTERTLRGERVNNTSSATGPGDLAVGTITGEGTPTAGEATGNLALGTVTGQGDNDSEDGDTGAVTGNLGLNTVGRNNLVHLSVDTAQLADNAVTTGKIAGNTIQRGDVSVTDGTNLTSANIQTGTITGEGTNDLVANATGDLGLLTVGRANLALLAVDTEQLAVGAVTANEVSVDDAENLTAANIRTGTLRGTIDPTVTADVEAGAGSLSDIGIGTISGQGDNDDADLMADPGADNTSVTGNLGLNTVGRRNLVNGAVDATKLSTSLLGDLVTEAELTVLLGRMKSDEAGGTAPKNPNDNDGFLHWNHLEGVPNSILSAQNLSVDDGTPNENTGPDADLVSFSEIKDLTKVVLGVEDGRITGLFIKDGDLTSLDLKDGDIRGVDLAGDDTPGNIVTGAVSSAKIADETIETRDIKDGQVKGAAPLGTLAPGETNAGDIGVRTITAINLADGAVTGRQIEDATVTTEELKATAESVSNPGDTSLTTGTPAPVVSTPITIPQSPTSGAANHKVLLTGQATLDCTGCTAPVAVSYTLGKAGTAIAGAPVMTATVDAANGDIVLPVSWITLAAQGPHTYDLIVTGTFTPAGSAVVKNATLNVVDLGRA